jgi:DNA-binding NtrC family response regulator
MGIMATLWIVHRDERVRGALARLSAAGSDALLGDPSDRAFETTPAPRIVLLGVESDLEAELEFAHRHAARIPDARWILLPKPGDEGEVARLFDTLAAEILVFPPAPERLRQRIRNALAARPEETLSARRLRDSVSARFSRFFADLELPQLLRALDPRLLAVPLLVRGEPGSGRGLLAHYVHIFGGGSQGGFVRIPCEAVGSAKAFRETTRDAAECRAEGGPSTVCLENLDRLPLLLQRELQDWIEIAMPPGWSGARHTRWIATLGDGPEGDAPGALDRSLAQSLAGVAIRIPPLRERPLAIGAFAADTALEWCTLHGERSRQFSPGAVDALRDYPWPGNLRELEAVVTHTLASGLSDPIEAAQLRFDQAEEPAESGGWTEQREPDHTAVGVRATTAPRVDAPAVDVSVEEPEPTRRAAPAATPPATPRNDLLQRLVRSVSHQMRNPLVAIRTFASLLPERFEDPEFRGRFHEIVGSDLGRIERVLDKLSGFAGLEPAATAPVNVAALLEQLLEQRRPQIQARRLLVLKEIDRTLPFALCDEVQLRFALESLLDKIFEWVPERADLYLASKHHPSGLRGEPAVRVLIRFHDPAPAMGAEDAAAGEDLSLRNTSIEIVLAELLIGSQGGTLTVDTTDAEETVILLDLPAPA